MPVCFQYYSTIAGTSFFVNPVVNTSHNGDTISFHDGFIFIQAAEIPICSWKMKIKN